METYHKKILRYLKDEKLFHLMFHDKKNGNFLMHQMKLHLIHYSYALMEYFGNLRLDIKPYERNFKYLKFLFNLILNENTIQFEKKIKILKNILEKIDFINANVIYNFGDWDPLYKETEKIYQEYEKIIKELIKINNDKTYKI